MSWGLFYEIILLCMSILPHLTAFGPVITLIFSIYNIWEHCPNIDLAGLWDRLKMVTSHTTHCWLCWGNPVQYFPPSPTGSHKGIFFVVLNSWFSEWRLKRWRLLTSTTSPPSSREPVTRVVGTNSDQDLCGCVDRCQNWFNVLKMGSYDKLRRRVPAPSTDQAGALL